MANFHSEVARARWQRWLPGGLLVVLLLLGASLYRGYGLTWDEPIDHDNGVYNLYLAAEYLLPPAMAQRLGPPGVVVPAQANWLGFDHGVAFEMP
ncbi:MAG: hypothetical protein EOO62_19540, partial [Hymenobacter sp.]